jgi:hypothetical protein
MPVVPFTNDNVARGKAHNPRVVPQDLSQGQRRRKARSVDITKGLDRKQAVYLAVA